MLRVADQSSLCAHAGTLRKAQIVHAYTSAAEGRFSGVLDRRVVTSCLISPLTSSGKGKLMPKRISPCVGTRLPAVGES
eukprot:scaffold620_cov386-Prasinococcus_capsulatus_cf.AAC.11